MPADLRSHHLRTLAYLLSRGARHNFVPVTTSELGRAVGRSQQAASRHVLDLEEGGLLERGPAPAAAAGRGVSLRITQRGYSEMARVYEELRGAMESHPSHVELDGVLVSGMGEGAYYMSLDGYTAQFRERIGYVPFPGTLNVRLSEARHVSAAVRLDQVGGELIDGFSDGRRTYGWVRCFAGSVNGAVGCHLIRLERTHHDPATVEVISRSNIRRACGLEDGSPVSIRLPM